jgi:N-acyl-phosphatidylethanolamine-hydrolysing phospholipase D
MNLARRGGLLGALLPSLAGCLAAPPEASQGPRFEDPVSLYAPNFDGDAFFNPWQSFEWRRRDALRFVATRPLFRGNAPLEVRMLPNDGARLAGVSDPPELTWVGHATFVIHDGDDVVLTDPHFSKRALVPARAFEPGLPLESIPPDAFAVISHNHYDHLDAETVDRLPESVAWFVPAGLAEWFRDRGRPRVTELGWWESVQHGRWTLTCLPSQHWSRRIGQGRNQTLWCSWLLDSGEHRYYFAGDTGYFHGFREFGRRFDPIDVAMLPIGAYAPRWFMRYQHMDPEEAYRAFVDLGARFMLPMHWGTFDLTHEPVDEPGREFERVIAAAGGDPARSPVLGIGESWPVPPRNPRTAVALESAP